MYRLTHFAPWVSVNWLVPTQKVTTLSEHAVTTMNTGEGGDNDTYRRWDDGGDDDDVDDDSRWRPIKVAANDIRLTDSR